MASYHLSVKTIKRSAGRSATAAAAYRVGERIECQREGRIHDYTRKQGIEETFILTPKDAPDWASDRSRLWNEAEARLRNVDPEIFSSKERNEKTKASFLKTATFSQI